MQTGPPNTGQFSGEGRPSAPPVSPALPGDSKEDTNILSISAELTEFRKLRELDPELSMKEYVDFNIYFDGKQKAAEGRNGPPRARAALSGGRSEPSPPEGWQARAQQRRAPSPQEGLPRAPPPWPTFCGTQVGLQERDSSTLAQIPLVTTTDVAATGVGRK